MTDIRSKVAFFLSAGVFLMLFACTTAPETPAPVATRSLTEYRTFAFDTTPVQSPSSDPGAAERLRGPTRDAIVEVLSAKGFREVSPADAEFLVKVQTEFLPDGLTQASEKRYVKIEFLDRGNNAVLWANQRGRSSSSTLNPNEVRQMVIVMLDSVPNVGN